MKVSELMDILGEMDQDLEVWIYVVYGDGEGWERLDKYGVEVRSGRVEIA